MQKYKISFKGQNIYVGIDVHLKTWHVTTLTESGCKYSFAQHADAKEPLIVEASWVTIQRDAEMGAYFSNCCQSMKPHKAIIKVARKLACRAYAVLKTKTMYAQP